MDNQKRIVRLYPKDADWLWAHRQIIEGQKETMADVFKRLRKENKE